MANTGMEEEGAPRDKAGGGAPVAPSLSLRLLLWGAVALALSILLAEGDGMPPASQGEQAEARRLALAPEVSPYRGDGPFRVHNTTHGVMSTYAHTREGWTAYLSGMRGALEGLLLGFIGFGWDPLRILQIYELQQTCGMVMNGAFQSYPFFPVLTPFHGVGSSAAALSRKFWPVLAVGGFFDPRRIFDPVVVAVILGRFRRTRFLVDVICIVYALLDMWPSLIGEFHVNERPTHNLRLLALSLGSAASRHRAWGAIMGMFYIGTGGPKLFPSFYRYWLWFGIYPSSTLADFPPALFFSRGEDGGWHPNLLAQAFGFLGGALEVTHAALLLAPTAATRRPRALSAAAVHLGIIFGRFDNGLCGWNSYWLAENLCHCLGPVHSAGWAELSPLAAAVVAAQGTLELLFFLGHGSYHSGMSHHTGNFRMQWLVFRDEAAWGKYLASATPQEGCHHGPLHGSIPTCVHTWGHGTHYPTASFGTFLYALNGGTYLQEVLPAGAAVEEEGFGPGLERLGAHRAPVVEWYQKERLLRETHHGEYLHQVDGLVGGFRFNASAGDQAGRPRAIYLGFASGSSVWDDSFYQPAAAAVVRDRTQWRPGEALFLEIDRQRPWRRTRRLRTWDLSRELPETPRSLVDRLLGSSPAAHLLEDRRIIVRHPFPLT